MKVKVLINGGYAYSYEKIVDHKKDEVIEVTDKIAKEMIACGFAEELKEKQAELKMEEKPNNKMAKKAKNK